MNTRRIAYECLTSIMIHQEYSNLCLRNRLEQVDAQKRPVITQVVYGTLENYLYVRYCWEEFASRPPKEEVSVLLDMAVYELLWMKTPTYALINEVVNIAKRVQPKFAGMVNAILHKVDQQGKRALPSDADRSLSIETSTPLWLIQMWNAQYGNTVCKQICLGNMMPRKSVARVNTLKISREELLAQDTSFHASEIVADACMYDLGNIARTTWFEEGYVSIQDEASQMIAPLVDPQENERILDVCSAPGTKACHMAQLMHNTGEIICGDLHEHRVQLIEDGAKRLGITNIHASCMDATVLEGLEQESFDRVLCDVPCSGYGTLSRKSDIKVHMKSSDMDSLIPIQKAILNKAATMVKPKGILVYSTCTLNKKENEKQISSFLKEHEEYTLLFEQTIFPFQYDCDGFYMAKLQRTEEIS